jgi:glutamate N-acetyltransferase / amino-acid N-acetyltransferase
MAVNLHAPRPGELLPVRGIDLGVAEAAIRKSGRRDLMLMRCAPGTRAAGVFTQNSFAAAPVWVCRRHLNATDSVRALLINAGNANCGTGAAGIAAALRTCERAAELLACRTEQVLPFSTGVILEPLPVERVENALPACVASLRSDHWAAAAEAIMTTETVPKATSGRLTIGGAELAVTGIAKGVGMLQPNMATMLAFIATDACISHACLRAMVKSVADRSFNRVTVDGDTSTNDSFVLLATQRAAHDEVRDLASPAYARLEASVLEVARRLAQSIARDGEGATKFITVLVEGARDEAEAVRVAKAIANSPLVKTAFFASDPNLGRLLMAIGNAGVADLNITGVDLYIGSLLVIARGERAPSYREEDGAAAMKPEEISIRVALGRGAAATTVWTCDFSYDYVKINAEYRT